MAQGEGPEFKTQYHKNKQKVKHRVTCVLAIQLLDLYMEEK
jgi:hypothetical protein